MIVYHFVSVNDRMPNVNKFLVLIELADREEKRNAYAEHVFSA